MRLIFFVLTSLLAIFSLAAVPHYEQRSAELPAPPPSANSAHQPSTVPSISTTIPDAVIDGQAEDFVTSHAFDNATTANLPATDWPSDEHAVDIRVGPPKQHVGTRQKGRLYESILNCIAEMTHTGKTCDVETIVYEAGKGTYATNAYLILESSIDAKEKEYPGIYNLTAKLVGDLYRLATENDDNCYWVDFKHSRRTRICNVPQYVMIVWPARGLETPVVRATFNIRFNGVTANHQVNCESSRKSITKHYKYHVRSEIARIMKWKEEKMRFFYSYEGDPLCFNLSEGWRPTGPWLEPGACNRPEKYEDMEAM